MGFGGLGRGWGVSRHLEEVIRFVFNDEDVMFARHGVDVSSALPALGSACGVLSRGDGVKNMWLAGAAALGRVPRGKEVVHVLGQKALVVHSDAEDFDTEGHGGLDGGGEAVLLGEDGVVPVLVAEHAQDLFQRGGAADCEA